MGISFDLTGNVDVTVTMHIAKPKRPWIICACNATDLDGTLS